MKKERDITVLLVDAGHGNRSLLAEALREGPYRVEWVADYAEVVSAARAAGPDAVLFRLPSSPAGAAAAWRAIEAVSRDSTAAAILVSPKVDVDILMRALEAGVRWFIGIPCSRGFLLSGIDRALRAPAYPGAGPGSGGPSVPAAQPLHFAMLVESILHGASHREELLRRELERGMRPGGSRWSVSSEELYLEGEEEHALYKDIVRALESGEFQLHYQPIIFMEKGSISGFEALIRWNHPQRGMLFPDSFIPFAERTGLIIPMGNWIIREAGRQIGSWQRRFSSDTPLTVSVNVSARQFLQSGLVEHLGAVADEHGINPRDIRIEITESAFMENMESANLVLLELKAKGFLLYMDDFGTGYSSLGYLMHFPVDVLKIDKSFVSFMHVDEQSEEIVRSVIGLAHNLKRSVVAEGVESESHFGLLRGLGCDYGQGYFFAKPLAPRAAEELLEQNPTWAR